MHILTHIHDNEWLQQRELQWQRRKSDFYDEDEADVATHKQFFFDGDFDAYITNIPELRFDTVYVSYPAQTLADMQYIIQRYWQFAHDSSNAWYLTFYQSTKDKSINGVFERLLANITYHPPELMQELFLWVYGESYQSPRVLDIGVVAWQPTIEIEGWRMATGMRSGVGQLLFEEDNDYAHYNEYIEYFLSVLPLLEVGCFDSTYAEPNVKNKFGRKLSASQANTRDFFMQLYGYDHEETVHNSPENELYIREAIEKLDMPAEFYPFIDFIHKYKQDAIDISE